MLPRSYNATKLGIDHQDIDILIADRTKTLGLHATRYIHDEDHFINDFLSQCPSGHYCNITPWLNIEPCGEEIVSYAI